MDSYIIGYCQEDIIQHTKHSAIISMHYTKITISFKNTREYTFAYNAEWCLQILAVAAMEKKTSLKTQNKTKSTLLKCFKMFDELHNGSSRETVSLTNTKEAMVEKLSVLEVSAPKTLLNDYLPV